MHVFNIRNSKKLNKIAHMNMYRQVYIYKYIFIEIRSFVRPMEQVPKTGISINLQITKRVCETRECPHPYKACCSHPHTLTRSRIRTYGCVLRRLSYDILALCTCTEVESPYKYCATSIKCLMAIRFPWKLRGMSVDENYFLPRYPPLQVNNMK